MKPRLSYRVILPVLFGYILLQFLWWEVLLVRQTGTIISEKQKLAALNTPDPERLNAEIAALQSKKIKQTVMIVSEGTVFLLLLLFGIYKIKKALDKETEVVNQQKNFFLSITHELKTPLAATKLQLQTLRRQQLSEDTREQLIRSALLETERLNALLDNVLLASRLEEKDFNLHLVRENFSETVSQTINRYYADLLADGQLDLRVDRDVYGKTDGQTLPSILTNLVDNAVKYSGKLKKIDVQLKAGREEALLTVKDNGPGIPDKEKELVFRRFYRSGNEETRTAKGTGLGLYIVRYLVRMHGASITLRDNFPSGSIFEIRFPLA